jgi:hypothetical protein
VLIRLLRLLRYMPTAAEETINPPTAPITVPYPGEIVVPNAAPTIVSTTITRAGDMQNDQNGPVYVTQSPVQPVKPVPLHLQSRLLNRFIKSCARKSASRAKSNARSSVVKRILSCSSINPSGISGVGPGIVCALHVPCHFCPPNR